MAFDILHYALMTAERAVKIMKQKEKNKQEDEMMEALKGVSVSGQVAPDSQDGNLWVFLCFHNYQRLFIPTAHFIQCADLRH